MSTVTIPRIGGYQRPAVMDWLTTVDHKKLGILYLWFTLFFFAVGGIFALLVRTQLAVGENTFLANDAYNQIFYYACIVHALPIYYSNLGWLR